MPEGESDGTGGIDSDVLERIGRRLRGSARFSINGSHKLEIEETVNSGAMDSYHGTEERNFAVTGAAGPVPDWATVVYKIGKALVGKWDERVGDLITALDIIAEFAFPGNSGEGPEGIFYDWTVNGEGQVGNWLRWTTEYLPKEDTNNDNHQITVDTGIDNIPDGSSTTARRTTMRLGPSTSGRCIVQIICRSVSGKIRNRKGQY